MEQLKEERVYFGSQLKSAVQSRCREHEAAGHAASAVRKQREHAVLPFFLLFIHSERPTPKNSAATFRVGLLPQLASLRNAHAQRFVA